MANCKVIAVANQKGGVGKSTSVYCIGAGLAMDGKRVLLVDVDPQGDLTKMLGQRKPHELTHTLAEQMNAVVQHSAEPEHPEILHHHEGFDFVPANRSLSAVEMGLVHVMSRETVLNAIWTVSRRITTMYCWIAARLWVCWSSMPCRLRIMYSSRCRRTIWQPRT